MRRLRNDSASQNWVVSVTGLLEIRKQPLSTLLADFLICKSCQVVDRDHERMRVGYACSNCGVPGDGARAYFPMSVVSLIDLMQEFYHMKQESGSELGEDLNLDKKGNHRLAVVIFFCTLGEVLLEEFLTHVMMKLELPPSIQKRLLDDNMFVKQRIEKVFPALTGVQWKETVHKLSKGKQLNYSKTAEFYQTVIKKRNVFLHKGIKWAIPKEMPENCLRQIWPIVNLFVALHNEFITSSAAKRSY